METVNSFRHEKGYGRKFSNALLNGLTLHGPLIMFYSFDTNVIRHNS